MATLKTVPTQKKYGLQKKSAVKKSLKSSSFFSTDLDEELQEDEEEESSTQRGKGAKGRNNEIMARANREIQKFSSNIGVPDITSLTEEERMVYDYDGAYDAFKQVEKEKLNKAMGLFGKDEPKSRYISKIQAVAVVREKEKDRIYERLLLKERQLEDAEYGDKPKFITSEYKRKLMEDQKWEMEDKIADEIDRRTGASSQGMHGFYANLLTKNIAMGGDVAESAVSAYTAGSRRQQLRLGEEAPTAEERVGSVPVTANEEPKKRATVAVDAAADQEIDDREDKRRKVESTATVFEPKVPAAAAPAPQTSPVTEPVPVPVVSKAELILSAKERYLLRKQQQQQSSEPSSD